MTSESSRQPSMVALVCAACGFTISALGAIDGSHLCRRGPRAGRRSRLLPEQAEVEP